MSDKFIVILLVLLAFFQSAGGQSSHANRLGHCQNPKFDREVARWIGFKAPTIDVDSLRNNPTLYTLLDAREPEEYAVSHLEGALNCGYDHFDLKQLDSLDKNKPVAIYCSIGVRSEKIALKLREAGFQQVFNVYGSIFEWVNRGYPVVDSRGMPTERIHTYNRLWSRWVNNPTSEKVTKK